MQSNASSQFNMQVEFQVYVYISTVHHIVKFQLVAAKAWQLEFSLKSEEVRADVGEKSSK